MSKALSALIEARGAAEEEIVLVKEHIDSLSSDPQREFIVEVLQQECGRLVDQRDVLDSAIERVRMIADRKTKLSPGDGHRVNPIRYEGMRLNEAVKAYMNEHNRGPLPMTQILKDLVAGGYQARYDRGPNRGKLRDVTLKDLRILCANNANSLLPNGEHKRSLVRFVWDKDADTISMELAPSLG